MRFIRLMCAMCLLACGNGDTQSDAGVDAAGSGDAASDAGTDVVLTNGECIEAGAACQACCTTIHADASGIFDKSIADCACGTTCQSACASSFCASQPATKACDGCISKQCYPNAQAACNADPACKAWLACLVPCP